MNEKIHIYHTNDLHSHFENWPKIVHYINSRKLVHKQSDETMLLFDIGDHVDRFNEISEATFGKVNVVFLNKLGYNNVTIGNNEGITLSHDSLNTLYDAAKFPVIAANLYYINGERPKWIKPYDIHTLPGGIKIGVIGATINYSKLYELLGWKVEDPFMVLGPLLKELKEKTDCVVMLSHLGISEDERLASTFPEIDVILGGHTHHLLEKGKVIGKTLLCGAGKYGMYVGHVELTFNSEQKKLLKTNATVVSTELQKECLDTVKELKGLSLESKNILDEEIIVLNEGLDSDWFNENRLNKHLASALKEWCNSEIAMVNAGVLLDSLPKGKVSKGDIHRICPHPINPCKLELKGDALREIINEANTVKMQYHKIKGLGFRGEIMGRMIYDGVEYNTEALSDGLEHVRDIYINGDQLDPERLYSVATIDMFTFGFFYPEMAHAANKEYYMPEMLRDLLAWKLRKLKY